MLFFKSVSEHKKNVLRIKIPSFINGCTSHSLLTSLWVCLCLVVGNGLWKKLLNQQFSLNIHIVIRKTLFNDKHDDEIENYERNCLKIVAY